MTGGATMAAPATGQPTFQGLAKALQTALLGVTTCPSDGPLSNPSTASAFLPGSSVQPVDLGPGLWALVRKNKSNERTVLCVYNVTGKPVTFDPTRHLNAEDSGRPGLLFLTGGARCHGSVAAPAVEVPAHSFVWLGRFSDAEHPDSEGEAP